MLNFASIFYRLFKFSSFFRFFTDFFDFSFQFFFFLHRGQSDKIFEFAKMKGRESAGCAKINVIQIKLNKTNLKCIKPDTTRLPTNVVVNSCTSIFFCCKTVCDRFMATKYWKVDLRISYACSKRSKIYFEWCFLVV